MIDSWVKTTTRNAENSAELRIYVSGNDPKVSEYKKISLPDGAYIEYGAKKTMVGVLNYYCTEKYPDMDYYSEVNDDHVFVTSGWNVLMQNYIDRKNNGISIVYGITQQFPTATMHGGKLIRELGYFFPPIFSHMFVDFWIRDFGFGANIMVYAPDILIDHMHPTFGKGEHDKVYQDGGDESRAAKAVYEKWCKTSKEKDIKKIKDKISENRTITAGAIETITDNLSVFMTTYDRLDLLQNAVDTYLKSDPRPPILYVFDDLGQDSDKARDIVLQIPEAIWIPNDKNYGSDGNINHAMKTLFDKGAKHVCAIDSDCLFSKNWYQVALEVVQIVNLQKNIISLITLRVHKKIKPTALQGFICKEYIGGLGLVISKDLWEKHIPKKDLEGWDGKMCTSARKEGIGILSCTPSCLQHTGFYRGKHARMDDTECVADDFEEVDVGTMVEFEKIMPGEILFEKMKPLNKKGESDLMRAGIPLSYGPTHKDWNNPGKYAWRYIWIKAHGMVDA